MDKRKARSRADAAPADGNGSPASSGGVGPLFFVMAAVVLVVIAAAFLFSSGGEDKPGRTRPAEGVGDVSVKHKREFKPQPPWSGEVNGMHGSIHQGMDEAQVIAQFKPPEVAEITHSEYDGIRTLEFADAAGQGGIFRTGGGVKLIVKIDMATGKVVWFQPPMPIDPD